MAKKKGTKGNQDSIDLKLGCTEPGCTSTKTFKSVSSLMSHILAAHKKKYTIKQLEGIVMADKEKVEQPKQEEVKSMDTKEGKQAIDLNELLNKINAIDSKIPDDLCEQFPNLCKLNDKVDGLSKDVEGMKDNQLKKLVLQVPKTEDKVNPVDLTPVNTKLDIVNNSVTDLASKVEKIAKTNKPQTKDEKRAEEVKPIEQTTQPEPDTHSHDHSEEHSHSDIVERAVSAVKSEMEKEIVKHNTADEVINCPECRSKILNKLATNVEGKDFNNPVFVDFMKKFSFIKDEKGEGTNGGKDDKETVEGDVSGSAGSDSPGQDRQPHEPNPETSQPEQRAEGGSGVNKTETGSQEAGAGSAESQSTDKAGDGTSESAATAATPDEATDEPAAAKPESARTCRLFFSK